MPRFICNHLQPSATLVLFVVLVLFVAEAATLLVATLLVAPRVNLQVRVADKSVSATLSVTLQPTEYQCVMRIFKQRLQMADENENYYTCKLQFVSLHISYEPYFILLTLKNTPFLTIII